MSIFSDFDQSSLATDSPALHPPALCAIFHHLLIPLFSQYFFWSHSIHFLCFSPPPPGPPLFYAIFRLYPRGPSVVLLIRLLVHSTPLEFPALPIVQDQGASCCNKLLNNVSKGYRPQCQLTLWSLISQSGGGHIMNDRPTAGESTLKALSLPASAKLCLRAKVSSGFIVVVAVKEKTLQRPYLLLFQR